MTNFLFFVLLLCSISYSQPPCTFTGNFNTYHEGLSTSSSGYFVRVIMDTLAPIVADTVIMIIQMQGGVINSDNSNIYGDGTGRGSLSNTAGVYEFNIVADVITVSGFTELEVKLPFENRYSSSGNSVFQIVTVPLCSTATIAGNVDADAWNGKVGGIISLLSYGSISVISSTISASSKGFRGAPDYTTPTVDPTAPTNFWATEIIDTLRTGFKGEGYIGFPTFDTVPTSYPFNRDCGKGAPGNAGGGGNAIDAGGGGGGNCGIGGDGGDSTMSGGRVVTAGLGGATNPQTRQRLFFGKWIISNLFTNLT